MNNITQKILPSTLENILEKIFIFHLKSGTLIANFVMATLEDVYNFSNAGKEYFSYTACTGTKHYFIEAQLFQQPVLNHHFSSLSIIIILILFVAIRQIISLIATNKIISGKMGGVVNEILN